MSVGSALVLAEDADGLEAEGFISGDCALVFDGGGDGEAVVAAVVAAVADQPADDRSERLGAKALGLVVGQEHDVEGYVPIVGLGLLMESEPAGDLVADVDSEGRALVAKAFPLVVRIARVAHQQVALEVVLRTTL